MSDQQLIIGPTLTSQVRDMVYLLGQTQTSSNYSPANGVLLINSAGIKKRLVLNDTGTSVVLVDA